MQIKSKYLLIAVLILVAGVLAITVSYIGAQVESKNVKTTEVKTGKLNLELSDDSLNVNSLKPIYDKNYLDSAYKKEFTLTNKSDSLNACSYIYLDISDISDSLKSKYFKYAIVDSEGNEIKGDFEEARKEFPITSNTYIESGKSINYTLYIWISYLDDVDQMDMLGTKLVAKVVAKSSDIKDKNMCISTIDEYLSKVETSDDNYIRIDNSCFRVRETFTESIALKYFGKYENEVCYAEVINEEVYNGEEYSGSEVKVTLENWYKDNLTDSSIILDVPCNINGGEYSVGNGKLKYPICPIQYDETDEVEGLVPVINIKKTAKVISGVGTNYSPYILEK